MAVSKRLRYEVLRRDKHVCRYCGAAAPDATLTVDHVVPTALGGSDDPSNLVAACSSCNSGKSASSPDSAVVAEVEADAVRWSRAQSAAVHRMLLELEARDTMRLDFKMSWDAWTDVSGQAVTLPEDWTSSVDQFMAVGLPMAVLVDCVDKAMRNKRIRQHDTFRYMCGIAWKRVGELRATIMSELEGPRPALASKRSPYEEALGAITGSMTNPEQLGDPKVRAELAARFDAARIDDEDEDGNPVDLSSWPESLKATVELVSAELDSGWSWSVVGRSVLSTLTGGEPGRFLEESRATNLANQIEFDDDDVARYALTLAAMEAVAGDGSRRTRPGDPWGES